MTKFYTLLLDIAASFSLALLTCAVVEHFGMNIPSATFGVVFTTVLISWRTL